MNRLIAEIIINYKINQNLKKYNPQNIDSNHYKLQAHERTFEKDGLDISEFDRNQRGGYDWNNQLDRNKFKVFYNNSHRKDTPDYITELNQHMTAAKEWFDNNINKTNGFLADINEKIEYATTTMNRILPKIEELKKKKSDIKSKMDSSYENDKLKYEIELQKIKEQQAIYLTNCHSLLIALNNFVKKHHVNIEDLLIYDKLNQFNDMIKNLINSVSIDPAD